MAPILAHRFDKKPIVISLGGSILVQEHIDVAYIKKFNDFIRRQVKNGRRFIIITGGGRIAREYQEAASAVRKVSNFDKDWIGIHATRLNAQLLRTVMADICTHVVIDKRKKLQRLTKPVAFGSGWRPGASTDHVSVSIAIDYGAEVIINASNIDHVYSADFRKDKTAQPFNNLTWKQYRGLVPKEWKPGLSSPIDPVAARLAERHKIQAIVVKGNDLENFERLVTGKHFSGTIIG